MALRGVRLGQMRHRLQLQSQTESKTAGGGITRTWTTERTIRARIRPLSGREVIDAAQAQAHITHEITVHYDTTITTDYRLKDPDTGDIYHLESPPINLDGLNRVMQLMCKQEV